MTDVAVLPRQLEQSVRLLAEASEVIQLSAKRLDRAERSTVFNDADRSFSARGFIASSRHTTDDLTQASQVVRALSDHVQLTLTRIIAADDGGAAANADPTPGHLLRPGVGFGSSGLSDAGSMWLNLYTLASMADDAPRVSPTVAALGSKGGRPVATYQAVRQVAEEASGLAPVILQHSQRPATIAGDALKRAAQVSPWADEITLAGARTSVTLSRLSTAASASKVLPVAKAAGTYGVGTISVALDTTTAVESFLDGDKEKGAIYAIRAAGGTATMIPGMQVVGLSVVGATYVVEYREEIWGGFMSAVDFAEDVVR